MGQDFNNAQFPQTIDNPLPPKKSNRTIWIILIVVLVLLCCCCIIVVGGVATNMDAITRWLEENGVNLQSRMTVWLH